MSNKESNNSQNDGLEDYNNISNGSFQYGLVIKLPYGIDHSSMVH